MTFNGTKIVAPFKLMSDSAIDVRENVKTLADRNSIPLGARYKGLRCFVEELEVEFQLIHGIENKDWKPLMSNEFQNDLVDNLLSICKSLSSVMNKPIDIPNVVMNDLNNIESFKLIDAGYSKGVIFF